MPRGIIEGHKEVSPRYLSGTCGKTGCGEIWTVVTTEDPAKQENDFLVQGAY